MTQQGDEVLAVVFGLLLLTPGLLMAVRPARVAHANDTKGPKWRRDYKRPAYPGRTRPGAMRGLASSGASSGSGLWG